VPDRWREALGFLAHDLHFQPSELLAMDVEDLGFWMDRRKEVNRG
jgi:hypothetical protein